MPEFGYHINPGKQIDYDRNDKSLAAYILSKEPTFNICFSCGTCAATCTTGNFGDFSFRRLILLIKRGETEAVSEEFIKCMLCGKCLIACPRGVNTRNILFNLKYYFEKEYLTKTLNL